MARAPSPLAASRLDRDAPTRRSACQLAGQVRDLVLAGTPGRAATGCPAAGPWPPTSASRAR